MLAKRLEKGESTIYVHPSKVELYLKQGWCLYGTKQPEKKRGRPKKK